MRHQLNSMAESVEEALLLFPGAFLAHCISKGLCCPSGGTGNDTPRASDRENKAKTLTIELLKQMMESATAMLNGSSAEAQEQLDAATREQLQNYHQDQTNAKIEVFGYEISEEEIEALPEPTRKEVRKKLEAIIRRGTEARYKAQLVVRRNCKSSVP